MKGFGKILGIGAIILALAGCERPQEYVKEAKIEGPYIAVAKKFQNGSRHLHICDYSVGSHGQSLQAVDEDGEPGFEKINYRQVWNENDRLKQFSLEDCEEKYAYAMEHGRERILW